jgi:hypothetical protein
LISGITLPNWASITNTYDSLARLTNTALLANYLGHTLDGYGYGLDLLGLRTNITRNLGLTTNTVAIGYDGIGQLTSWSAREVQRNIAPQRATRLRLRCRRESEHPHQRRPRSNLQLLTPSINSAMSHAPVR